MHNVSQHSYRIIIAHVLKVHVIHLEGRGSGSETGWERLSAPPKCPAPAHLQKHVPWLDAPVSCHGPSLHDGADVDAPVSPLIALAHNGDAQEVVLLCGRSPCDEGKPKPHDLRALETRSPTLPVLGSLIPMLSVTVMMLRDMVESVTLLKDEVCGGKKGKS